MDEVASSQETGTSRPAVRWTLSLLMPLLTVVVAHTCFTPHFSGNDDAGMNLIAAGVVTSPSPSPFLMFIHPLLGQLLSLLYQGWPALPWYALFMHGVMIFASVAVCVPLLAARAVGLRAVLLAGFLMTFGLSAVVSLQFTLVAAMCGQAAIVWWWVGREFASWRTVPFAMVLVLVGLAVLIRPETSRTLLVFVFPLVLIDLWQIHRDGRFSGYRDRLSCWARRTGAPLVAGTALIVLLSCHHTWFYHSTPGWRDFSSYNRLRGQFTDYWRGTSNANTNTLLSLVGWSQNDYDLIRFFFFVDREVFSAEKLRVLNENRPASELSLAAAKAALQAIPANPVLAPLLVAALVPLFFLQRRTLGKGILVWGAALASWLLVAAGGHYCPQHFVQSLLGFVAVCSLALLEPGGWSFPRRTVALVGCLAFAWCVRAEVKALHAKSVYVRNASRTFHEQVHALNPEPSQLYVMWGGSLPIQHLLPFRSLHDLRSLKVFPLGCMTNTPLTDQRLREFAINDLLSALTTRDDVFLVSDAIYHNPLLVNYFAEHFHRRAELECVFDPPAAQFKVYRVRLTGPDPSPVVNNR